MKNIIDNFRLYPIPPTSAIMFTDIVGHTALMGDDVQRHWIIVAIVNASLLLIYSYSDAIKSQTFS
ncbi:MAG: hypothetical protein H0X70_07610 [Segetibacter sp.]|nr:hypothetical protein [Segetibacter sp.]